MVKLCEDGTELGDFMNVTMIKEVGTAALN